MWKRDARVGAARSYSVSKEKWVISVIDNIPVPIDIQWVQIISDRVFLFSGTTWKCRKKTQVNLQKVIYSEKARKIWQKKNASASK